MELTKEFQNILVVMVIKPSQERSVINSSSLECYDALAKHQNAYLIDVRTKAEWEFIGLPDLSTLHKKIICIEWNTYPDMKINQNFLKQIQEKQLKVSDSLYLICRSGQRSYHAGVFLMKHGYMNCYNVEDGFEGLKTPDNKRSLINGWKFNNLPWQQN